MSPDGESAQTSNGQLYNNTNEDW